MPPFQHCQLARSRTSPRCSVPQRAALHVAAATGRADIVRQLAAAGASLNKALPMDYRTLLRQHSGMLAAGAVAGHAQAQGQQQEPEAGGAATADVDAAAAGVAGLTLEVPASADGCDGSQQQPDQLFAEEYGPSEEPEPAAPPPKRGRYVAAGPPPIAAPSLQYCTALHLAALHGHLEVVAELLGTVQADVNAKNIEGATPLHMAAFAGHAQVGAAPLLTSSLRDREAMWVGLPHCACLLHPSLPPWPRLCLPACLEQLPLTSPVRATP